MRGLRADDVRSALRVSDTDDEASDTEAAEDRRWVHTDEICDEMCDSTCCNPAFTGPCGLLTLLLLSCQPLLQHPSLLLRGLSLCSHPLFCP